MAKKQKPEVETPPMPHYLSGVCGIGNAVDYANTCHEKGYTI